MLNKKERDCLVSNLNYLRTTRGESVNSIAVSCGIKASTLSRFLSGEITSPRTATLASLANYFNLTPEELVGSDVSKLPKNRPPVDDKILRSTLIPLVTGAGAASLYFLDLWPYKDSEHELAPLCWLPPPPDSKLINFINARDEETSDKQPVFAFTVVGSAMKPSLSDGDLVYFANAAVWQPKDGQIVLARRVKEKFKEKSEERDRFFANKFVDSDETAHEAPEIAEYLVRKLVKDDRGNFFLKATFLGEQNSELISLQIGKGMYDDQILGVAVGKYSRL